MALETQLIRGVTKNYGARETTGKYGSNHTRLDNIKLAKWVFDYDELPTNDSTNMGLSIPANSTIISAKLRIITAFTSTSTTTDLTVGLRTASASSEDIDDDGLITAAQATQTTIAVVNSIIDGSSGTPAALIGKTIGTSAGELYVVGSVDDLLTGRAEMLVEYVLPNPQPA
jgi:hypothetical protein